MSDKFKVNIRIALPVALLTGLIYVWIAGLGHVSPIEVMQYLYYPYLLGVGALLATLFNYPRKYSK